MRWSKLKQIAESRFAKAVRGHAALHITRYGPGLSATMTRAWLTWDKREILSYSTAQWLQAAHAAQSKQQLDFASAQSQIQSAGQFSRFDLTDALEQSLSLSIDDALRSSTQLIRALAMLDARLGVRRLRQIQPSAEPPPVATLLRLRCHAEGFEPVDRQPRATPASSSDT